MSWITRNTVFRVTTGISFRIRLWRKIFKGCPNFRRRGWERLFGGFGLSGIVGGLRTAVAEGRLTTEHRLPSSALFLPLPGGNHWCHRA